MSKDKDIEYIKEVINKTNVSKICREENTTPSNVTFGRAREDKIQRVKAKLQKNIEDLEKLKEVI